MKLSKQFRVCTRKTASEIQNRIPREFLKKEVFGGNAKATLGRISEIIPNRTMVFMEKLPESCLEKCLEEFLRNATDLSKAFME